MSVQINLVKTPYYIVHGFWPESGSFDFGKQCYHVNGHLKRSKMVQVLAS